MDGDLELNNVLYYYPSLGTIHVKQLHPNVTYQV